MTNTLSIDKDIQPEDLEKKLNETSLSKEQIEEIMPILSNILTQLKDVEIRNNETNTKQELANIFTNETIDNDQNVLINMKNNKGIVLGAVQVNTITNNINITINDQENQRPIVEQPKPEPKPVNEQPKPEPKPVNEQPKPEPKPVNEQPKPNQPPERNETPRTIIDNRLQELNQNVDNDINMRTKEGFLHTLENLLYKIEEAETGISKRKQTKAGKETMKTAKNKLKEYKNLIKRKYEAVSKEYNPTISDYDIQRTKEIDSFINTLKTTDISKGQRGELSNQAPFLYNSPEIARRSNIRQENINQFERIMKDEVKQGAILRIFNGKEEDAINFYRKIAELGYNENEYNTYTTYANILNPSFERCGITLPILTPDQIRTIGGTQGMGQQSIQAIDFRNINRGQGTPQGGAQIEQGVQTTRQRKPKIDYSNMDISEAFQTGGLAGVLDKALSNCKNMTPGQRDTRKSIGVLSGYAAGIYGLYKFYTSKQSFLTKAGITAATIFGAQALTGEGPITLFTKAMTGGFSADELQDKFGNAFGDAVTGVSNSGMECAPTLSGSMYSMMIFNSTTTVGDIRAMTTSFKDNNAWKAFREDAINKLKSKYGENSAQYFSTTFPDTFNEQQRKTWLASFGITDSAPNSTTNVYEIANNASMNELIIEKFKEQNGVKETSNDVKKKEYTNYINSLKTSNQVLDIKTLEAHPEWFELDKKATYTERQVDKDFKTDIESKIDTLPINEPKKSELKTAIKRFYDERSIEAKPIKDDFSLKMDNDFLILTSHKGQETKINIKLNEIEGFGRSISFSDLSDLLNTADLANKILDIQKGKKPKGTPVFQSKTGTGGRGIYFNDASARSFDFDTRVLSGGWGGTIGKIDTLSDHPDEFAEYLSSRRTKNNKVETNTTNYPILQNLSKSGIEFYNEEEAKQAEARLNKVKEHRRSANGGYNNYKPFSIEGNKLVFTGLSKKTKIKIKFPDGFPDDFSGKSQDLSAFPTILANKDKFLAFMNTKSNGMRGSALPPKKKK